MINALPEVHIKDTNEVFIGGQKLPGFIEENGVTIIPCQDPSPWWMASKAGINRMTVTFIVGKITVDEF